MSSARPKSTIFISVNLLSLFIAIKFSGFNVMTIEFFKDLKMCLAVVSVQACVDPCSQELWYHNFLEIHMNYIF